MNAAFLIALTLLLSGCVSMPDDDAPPAPTPAVFPKPRVDHPPSPLWTGTCFPTWPTQPCEKYT